MKSCSKVRNEAHTYRKLLKSVKVKPSVSKNKSEHSVRKLVSKENLLKKKQVGNFRNKETVLYVNDYLLRLRFLKKCMDQLYENLKAHNIEHKKNSRNTSNRDTKADKSKSLSSLNKTNCPRTQSDRSLQTTEDKINLIYKNDRNVFSSNEFFDDEESAQILSKKPSHKRCFKEKPTLKIEKLENTIPEELYHLNFKAAQRRTPMQVNKSVTFKTCTKKSTHLTIYKTIHSYKNKKSKLSDILIRSIERIKSSSAHVTEIKYSEITDRVTITLPKINDRNLKNNASPYCNDQFKCQKFTNLNKFKVSSLCKMSGTKIVPPDRTFDRVNNWLKHCDFNCATECSLLAQDKNEIQVETNLQDKLTDITSITKEIERKLSANTKETNAEKENLKSNSSMPQIKESSESIRMFKKNMKLQKSIRKNWNGSSWEMYHDRRRSRSEPINPFAVIVENEENVRL